MENQETRTFKIYPNIEMKPVRFKNRFGIELAGHLYLPEGYAERKNAAIIVAGPFGAVKEQAAGLYAQQFASMGFVSLAFDPSFGGESGGEVRNTASPDIFAEDYSAAVDYVGLLDYVDRERIGAIGICGLSGMAITAAGTDTRIKAVATLSMYDMSRDMSRGHMDYYTEEQRMKIKRYFSEQRWRDAESGTRALGNHEIGFDEAGNLLTAAMEIPEELPEGADPVFAAFFHYYAKRARHSRAVNFVSSWTATMPVSFWNFPLMTNIKEVSPRPILLVAGENAHSRYYSEDAYAVAQEPKELVIVPGADHVDLYDNFDKIPFDKLESFFKANL
ncbi:MAG: alpha/beta hydrolase [Oscillospiraceae bacterium]|nr:alpha/beta hydrolase [Oscillospiraceae bacterium]